MGKLRRFLRFPPSERSLLLKAAFLFLAVRLGLLLLPFEALRRVLERGSEQPIRPPAGPGVPSADRVAWAVMTASRHLPGTRNCLVRALTAHFLLNRFGHRSSLRIGVRHGKKNCLEAHAWVEEGGSVRLGGAESGRFVPFPRGEAP